MVVHEERGVLFRPSYVCSTCQINAGGWTADLCTSVLPRVLCVFRPGKNQPEWSHALCCFIHMSDVPVCFSADWNVLKINQTLAL